jgi:hypothetical protein
MPSPNCNLEARLMENRPDPRLEVPSMEVPDAIENDQEDDSKAAASGRIPSRSLDSALDQVQYSTYTLRIIYYTLLVVK